MSDKMRPLAFAQLMDELLAGYAREGRVFGVYDVYRHEGGALSLFDGAIETPFGPAAGPHTQLSQNIIAAYAAGARFFELKTVQTLDGEDLPVSKPCILARDEGYNVEWSTELTVPEAMAEYIRAWFALKLISKAWGLGDPDGFAFNMSVGYDLEGIQSEKIDRFIEGMKDASGTAAFAECRRWALENAGRLGLKEDYIRDISAHVCNSITLSTLHGCPAGEIERIAAYLISEKKLHTIIKLNPTLLGYEFVRKTLDDLGYRLSFDDHHFREDLQFDDAVPMISRLLTLAAQSGVEFGVKLTNTLPVNIVKGELPGQQMHMSGKALYPLSIALAEKIERAFDGALRASYSGGADALNIGRLYAAGIWPITLATTLLKPGGYNRLRPIAQELAKMPAAPFTRVDLTALSALAREARRDPRIRAASQPNPKMPMKVPLIDCYRAPCSEGCPIGQDIPAYVELAGSGAYREALEVICENNPLPFITGTICAHRCTKSCTRNFYDENIRIREVKLLTAGRGYDAFLPTLAPRAVRAERIAVVGGGPGGMAAAYFLARGGAKVTIFEKRAALGGIVRFAIPRFRISEASIEKDAALIVRLGVDIRLNSEVLSPASLYEDGFTHVVLAIGAWKSDNLPLEKGCATDALEFLQAYNRGEVQAGPSVVIVGGGNTAIDAARAAKRLRGVGHVRMVYRRTRMQMPADEHELRFAAQEGVELLELLAPVAHEDGKLICRRMELGAPDSSGRRAPVATDEQVFVPADTVIAAIGEKPDCALISAAGACAPDRGEPARVMQNEKLFLIGDARRGPATVVDAIADAAEATRLILGEPDAEPLPLNASMLRERRAQLKMAGLPEKERDRCLGCSSVCGNCVDVCPNRANQVVMVDNREQILHIDALCNECGNCETFCPYDSAPYKEKFTLFACEEDMRQSDNPGFLVEQDGSFRVRLDGDARPLEPFMKTVRDQLCW
jgi:putative selenate reductase